MHGENRWESICFGGWRETDDEGVMHDWNPARSQLWQERFPDGAELHWNEYGAPAMVKIPEMVIQWDLSGNVRSVKNVPEFLEAAFYTAMEARQEEMGRKDGDDRDNSVQPAEEARM